MRKWMSILWCALALLFAAGCGQRSAAEAESTPSAANPDVTSVQEDLWTDDRSSEKLCVQFQPTAEITLANENRYYIPLDQEKWLREFTAAVEKANYEKHWQADDSGCGIFIYYQDEMWQLLVSGELQATEFGRVSAEDARNIYEMCLDVAENRGLSTPVRPEQIRSIMFATLEYQGTYTLTDGDKLDTLEQWLSDSTEMRGGTNCPLEAVLTLTLESGEELKLRLATDTCCVWMSEGVYHQYGVSDNRELLAFFTGE